MKMNFPKVTLTQRAQALLATGMARVDSWLVRQTQSEVFQRRVNAVTGGTDLRRYY